MLGLLVLGLGLALSLNLQPITWVIEGLRWVAKRFPSPLSGPLFIALGLSFMAYGLLRARATVTQVVGSTNWWGQFMEQLYLQKKLQRGPHIVAIGGGTGLSTLLRGLKHYTANLTAVVTVGDDGGSSGILREEQGIIPPGDIRNCIAALAAEETLLSDLFQYRFASGNGLEGHSFGNLFLTALSHITGDMLSAIQASSKVLQIRGTVLPSSLQPLQLAAEYEDGSVVVGESLIPKAGKRIKRLFCQPAEPQALHSAVEAILAADMIVLGPGSLYTSVIPNLLIPQLREALRQSKAPKVYVANVVTQPGETDDMSLSQHVEAIVTHANLGPQFLQAVLANTPLPEVWLAHYRQYGCSPVVVDADVLNQQGIAVLCNQWLTPPSVGPNGQLQGKTLRHNGRRVAKALVVWFHRYQKQGRR